MRKHGQDFLINLCGTRDIKDEYNHAVVNDFQLDLDI